MYSDIWAPFVGEVPACEQESGNPNDLYAVAIKKGSVVVGHMPQKSSAVCSLFLLLGGTIYCEITDNQRRYSSDICHRVSWRYLVNLFSEETRSRGLKYRN